MKTLDSCTVEFQQKTYRLNPWLRQRCALQPPLKGIALLDARISLRRTSSSPPLTFSGILIGNLFRSLRANDSLAPSVADTRCSTLNEFLHPLPQVYEVPVSASVDLF